VTAQFGIIFRRELRPPRLEPFFHELTAGIEEVLAETAGHLLVQMCSGAAEELAAYRHWYKTGAIDGVVLTDLRLDDRRIGALLEIGLPFVVLGDVTQAGEHSVVSIDNAGAMRDSVGYLAKLGHRRIGHVTGPPDLIHVAIRNDTFQYETRGAGLSGTVVAGDFSVESGREATVSLLRSTPTPTAIVYDNDLMACGGLVACSEYGVQVPRDLSLFAWDDSIRCQLAQPPLSALSRDVRGLGMLVGTALISATTLKEQVCVRGHQQVIVVRGTTAPNHEASPKENNGSVRHP
jgi:LacI family transcriptional regulator, repressor for deo operon, udp, cdd, tsx, nupC, and nupG